MSLLGKLARGGMFGIAGAVLAHKEHKPHPVFPGLTMMPDAQQFGDPASYLSAIQQWASGGLQQLQGTQNPFAPQQGQVSQAPPQGGM